MNICGGMYDFVHTGLCGVRPCVQTCSEDEMELSSINVHTVFVGDGI